MQVERLYGRPELRPSMVGLEVKGTLVASRRRIVEGLPGTSVVGDVARQLSGRPHALFLQPPFATTWQPMQDLVEIDAAIVSVLHDGDMSSMRSVGAAVAEHDLSNLYRTLMRIGRPSFVARRLDIAYMTYIRQGKMQTVTMDARAAEVELEGVTLPRYLCEHHISGWVEAALRLSGAERVAASHVSCRHDGVGPCRWRIEWDE